MYSIFPPFFTFKYLRFYVGYLCIRKEKNVVNIFFSVFMRCYILRYCLLNYSTYLKKKFLHKIQKLDFSTAVFNDYVGPLLF